MELAMDEQVGLSWFQQLLIKLGLGQWSVEEVKAYLKTVKENVEAKVETQKTMVRQQSSELLDKLPEAVKTRIPAAVSG
jgi:TPP-dependent pyruvate/acetoin dehydrogenase alpha subunit